METSSPTLESVCVAALMQASEEQVQSQLWGRPSLQPRSKPLSFRPPLRSAYSVPRLAPINFRPRPYPKPNSNHMSASQLRSGPSSTSRLFPLVKLDTAPRNSENALVTFAKLQTARGRQFRFSNMRKSVPLRTDLQVLQHPLRQFYAPIAAKLLPFRPPLLDRSER